MPVEYPTFGHSEVLLKEWRSRVSRAESLGARTPFFLFAAAPYAGALESLERLNMGVPKRFWLSAKTQPLPSLWRWWRRMGGGIEVVSEFEFRGALAEGFTIDQILLNGPAKQRWLPALSRPGLRVNFDSLGELKALLPLAQRDRWKIGLRLHASCEVDPQFPKFPTQFGMESDEAQMALRWIEEAGLVAEVLHFHLKTNLPDAQSLSGGLQFAIEFCQRSGWKPRQLDVGGGLPPAYTRAWGGRSYDDSMRLPDYAGLIRDAVTAIPSVDEVWLEPGRYLSAGSGVLVVGILDTKERSNCRVLICDGGRTLQALVSTWENHALHPLRIVQDEDILTAVHGPTCMAFDCLGRRPLPKSLREGDRLIWFEAGAYHLPWETRFSHGLAEVWWEEQGPPVRVRDAESFESYRSQWNTETDPV